MGAARRGQCLILLLVVLAAGCDAPKTTSPETSFRPLPEPPGVPAARLSGAAGLTDSRSGSTPFSAALPTATPTPAPKAVDIPDALDGENAVPGAEVAVAGVAVPGAEVAVAGVAVPGAEVAVAEVAVPADTALLLDAVRSNPFHQFGDDVYTWDGDRRVVILQMPVDHPAFEEVRERRGHTDGGIDDTPESRSWVQQCARRHAEAARNAPAPVYGAVTAQSVYACLGGFAHLIELFARYWWTDSGVACLSDAVTAHSLHGDDHPRPLSICPSAGYDPTAPQEPGWLEKRCAGIVAANPNSRYPTDPATPREPLPSCWSPLVETFADQAAENAEFGLPDSPHDCYHAFLGYVWARQTGRDSRPPTDLAIGCRYRAFEAIP